VSRPALAAHLARPGHANRETLLGVIYWAFGGPPEQSPTPSRQKLALRAGRGARGRPREADFGPPVPPRPPKIQTSRVQLLAWPEQAQSTPCRPCSFFLIWRTLGRTYGGILDFSLVPQNRSAEHLSLFYAAFFKQGPFVRVPGATLAGNRPKIDQNWNIYFSFLI
jgi:hypothetical protein